MSKCMTIAEEAIDQKETCTEVSPKQIVDLILEEVLLSAFITSDKGCSRIGDSNITDDFRQQQDQYPYPKDFEQVNHTKKEPVANQDPNLNSEETLDRSAKEHLELLKDAFSKKEENFKSAGECIEISEQLLGNNELLIQNGQIHLEKSRTEENVPDTDRNNRQEKIEIEYLNEGKMNKIYVPLYPSDVECASALEQSNKKDANEVAEELEERQDPSENGRSEQDLGRPFTPLTTEELRQSTLQVWGNSKSSLVGKWDGDALAQREEAVRLMEELSSVHVFPDSSADPNRPRACAFAEEDVKKMIKEIEEISFTQCHTNFEDVDVIYHPDGQGDADLESKSFTKSKDNIGKQQKVEKLTTDVNPDAKPPEMNEGVVSNQSKSVSCDDTYAPNPKDSREDRSSNNENAPSSYWTPMTDSISGEEHLQYDVVEDEHQLSSSMYDESLIKLKVSLEENVNLEENVRAIEDKFSSATDEVTKNETKENTSEVFMRDSINIKEFRSDICDEFFPETMSLSGNIGSPTGSGLDLFTLKNLEITSELGSLTDEITFQEKRSDLLKGSRSVNNTQENGPEAIQQGTINFGRLTSPSIETFKCLDSFTEEKCIVSMESSLFLENPEEMKTSQDPGNFLQGYYLTVDMAKNEQDSHLVGQEINEKLEEAVTSVERNAAADFENFHRDDSAAETESMKMEEVVMEDTSILPTQYQIESHETEKSLDGTNESIPGEQELRQTPSEAEGSIGFLTENGLAAEDNAGGLKFKLHSDKMYFGGNYEPGGQSPNEFNLTESEEAFIDMTESVIQIIEPSEHNNLNESSTKISFSLLSEVSNRKSASIEVEPDAETLLEKVDSSEVENPTKRVYSGMTTIGPMKNIDHDPKDLTSPEIDYGRMTHITSSRQLAKDIGMFSTEVTSIKILEEDDSDESANNDEDRIERTSLVNRDIASLTKVQKVREVMSYQPKSEEDFEDEEVLARPRLDLKDVESMTDERYKVPEVGIPLLSFEIGESDLNVEKELMDSMSLVISGLTSATYFTESLDDVNSGNCAVDDARKHVELSIDETAATDAEGELSVVSLGKESKMDETEPEDDPKVSGKDSQHEGVFSQQKYGTLSGVFKKASNKFMRKDGDTFVRDSKSLPRDTSRMRATESIRSMIDECQSSASNMLKKSRSLLKNTQGVFRSISQSRMSSESAPGRDHKIFPSESDVSTIERKFSGFLKKEDFTKAKHIIKSKVEKAFKSSDTTVEEPETEKRDLRVVARNKENLQVDRMENFKKLLPKTPLVYKSQFVRSQMNVQNNPVETAVSVSNLREEEDPKNTEGILDASVLESSSDDVPNEAPPDSEKETIQEQLQWINGPENAKSIASEELELQQQQQKQQQPDFIIMETVQGLPASDLESPSSDKENLNVDNIKNVETEKEGNESKKPEASSSLQMFSDGGRDVAPCFPEVDDDKAVTKPPSERKFKTKKKFTARFRSFWCSAFGRVKTPPKKGDLS